MSQEYESNEVIYHRYNAVLPELLAEGITSMADRELISVTYFLKEALRLKDFTDNVRQTVPVEKSAEIQIERHSIRPDLLLVKYESPIKARVHLVIPEELFDRYNRLAKLQGLLFAQYLNQAAALAIEVTRVAIDQGIWGNKKQHAIPLSIGSTDCLFMIY